MSPPNRVVWSEGMLLRTQHFQQAERFFERLIAESGPTTHDSHWGFTALDIDEARLAEGQIALRHGVGRFADGTFFDIPRVDSSPEPLLVRGDMAGETIYLCVPSRREGVIEYSLDGQDRTRRYHGQELDIPDTVDTGVVDAPSLVASLNVSLRAGSDNITGFDSIPLCRIIEKKSDGSAVLDESFIPTVALCAASAPLKAVMAELRGLLTQRSTAIATRMQNAAAGGVATTTDLFLLQTSNRNEALFRHLSSLEHVGPERLYVALICLAAELETFTTEARRPPEFSSYVHRNLNETFLAPLESVRKSLSAVFEQTALPFPLEDRGFGIRVGRITDLSVFHGSVFVLSAKASVGQDRLGGLTRLTTVGSVERIRDLVNQQLGGAPIYLMSSVPRQIAHDANAVYFGMSTDHNEWKAIAQTGNIAIHVSGDVPDLELTLWAVRGSKK